jgi:hypothetical protein
MRGRGVNSSAMTIALDSKAMTTALGLFGDEDERKTSSAMARRIVSETADSEQHATASSSRFHL